MNTENSLKDLETRYRQLEQHLIQSTDYITRANRDLKRQMFVLYFSISLLIFFQVIALINYRNDLEMRILTTITSVLALINCILLIRTRKSIYQLNEKWLNPSEKSALESIKQAREQLLHQQDNSAN